MKYLKEFATQADYEAAVAAGLANPNVSLINEPFGVQYKKYVPLGVFIQHVDGSLYKTDEWSAKGFIADQANGVAVVDEQASFVIAKKTLVASNVWCSPLVGMAGILATEDAEIAKTDFKGQENSNIMLSKTTQGAAVACNEYIFPNGANGYLPAAGESWLALEHADKINSALSIIGGESLPYAWWTSTNKDVTAAWAVSNGNLQVLSKTAYLSIRPFSALVL